jgi:hypothetical protein
MIVTDLCMGLEPTFFYHKSRPILVRTDEFGACS